MVVTTSKEDIEKLSKKYDVEYYRIHTLMEVIERELKIRRREEFKSNKDLFYRKAYAIANRRLYTIQQFNADKELSQEYMKQ